MPNIKYDKETLKSDGVRKGDKLAIKGDEEELKSNGKSLIHSNGDRKALKRTLRSNGNELKGDEPGAKWR